MYNRGTYRPSARDSQERIPQKIRRYTVPTTDGSGSSLERLREQVYQKIVADHEDDAFWSDASAKLVRRNVDRMSPEMLREALQAPPGTLIDWAEFQDKDFRDPRKRKNIPRFLRESAWKDRKGKWHNPLWYHDKR